MTALRHVADGLACGDLLHLGREESVAVYLVETTDGVAVVDPGPSTCRDALRLALRDFGAAPDDLRHVLLTHIHLDHAGVTGTLAREFPSLRVHVHARGAPHLVDPSRLLESARRIYGHDMERLWGAFEAVEPGQLVVLQGSEQLSIGDRSLRVAYTPGHAWHHVSYLDESTGMAFVGDVAGEGSQHGTPALPVAPPPDIDLEAWKPSLDRIAAWGPEALLVTHFGPVRHVVAHLDTMWDRLISWSLAVRASLASGDDDESRADSFAEAEFARIASSLTVEQAAHVDRDAIRSSWFGLARYWRKKAVA
ncbi:MAG: MBL fold metallo-hydrolase [Gemmatimonadetes bacterium]|nr:MBL fold metallo-hydrolase [Gemmatimonadota bacterium]